MSAELLEQVDAVGSAVGTTRAAVRRSILSPKIMCSELLCRARPDAGLGHLAGRWTYRVRFTHAISRMDCDEGIFKSGRRPNYQTNVALITCMPEVRT